MLLERRFRLWLPTRRYGDQLAGWITASPMAGTRLPRPPRLTASWPDHILIVDEINYEARTPGTDTSAVGIIRFGWTSRLLLVFEIGWLGVAFTDLGILALAQGRLAALISSSWT